MAHKDILGRVIKEGDKVAVAFYNDLEICTVTKLLPKMIKVVDVHHPASSGHTLYSKRCVVIDNEDMLAYLLKL